jgi:phage virion morphogenesis protein
MTGIHLNVTVTGLKRLSARIDTLLARATNLQPFMEDAAEYMVRSTQNRILRQKVSPDGEPWEELSEYSTIRLKGHDSQLFETGELARSIEVDYVSSRSMRIIANTDYASYMQEGVGETGGMIPGKEVPARPFMGFSEANARRIGEMLRKHIFEGGNDSLGGDQ